MKFSAMARVLSIACLFLASTMLVAQQAPHFTMGNTYGPVTDYPQDMLSADLNADGHTDLIVTSGGDSGSSVQVSVFMNTGSGTFNGPLVSHPVTDDTCRAAVVDLNSDGKLDLALACYHSGAAGATADTRGTLYTLLGDGSGAFAPGPKITLEGLPNAITVGDFNGDGKYDLAVSYVASQEISVYTNHGDGSFTSNVFMASVYFQNQNGGFPGTDYITDIVAGDFNGDGHMDLAYVDHCGGCDVAQEKIWTALNTGNGSSWNVQMVNGDTMTTTGVSHLRSLDMDMDGKSDLYFAYNGCHTPCSGVGVLYSNDGVQFTLVRPVVNVAPTDVIAGDFNNDGLMDLAYPGSDVNGGGTFALEILTANGKRSFNSTLTDYSVTSGFGVNIASGFLHSSYRKDLAMLNGGPETVEIWNNTDSNAASNCGYTSTISMRICMPASGSTVGSPVRVYGSFHPAHYPADRIETWVDGVKQLQVRNDKIDLSLTLAPGSHTLSLVGVDMTNRPLKKSYTFTVSGSGGGSCTAPSSAGVRFCSPAAGSTVSSPVTISAGARAASGNITAMRIYVDSVSQYTQNNSSSSSTMSLTKSLTMSTGTHNLTIVAYQSTGGTVKASESITVK